MHWLLLTLVLAPVPDRTGKELTLDMHERFAYATMMRTALIHGYPERARRHAGQLAELLSGTESEALAAIAREAAAAQDVGTMAAAVARVAESCGACHAENRVQPMFLGNPPQPKGDTLAARMGRHIWAADRMWVGLISRAVVPWQDGAQMLRKDPFFGAAKAGVPEAQVRRVSEIAAEAIKPQSWESRAAIYGRFLASCAECHQAYAR